ncbi:MAG: hypothetical protein VKJ04_01845 [Vampirovibrionales bacterium]|nr:hypothetical protein [Vampirovibrionales bacterium]
MRRSEAPQTFSTAAPTRNTDRVPQVTSRSPGICQGREVQKNQNHDAPSRIIFQTPIGPLKAPSAFLLVKAATHRQHRCYITSCYLTSVLSLQRIYRNVTHPQLQQTRKSKGRLSAPAFDADSIDSARGFA